MIVYESYIAIHDGGNWGKGYGKIHKEYQIVNLQRDTCKETEIQALQRYLKANGFNPKDYNVFNKCNNPLR